MLETEDVGDHVGGLVTLDNEIGHHLVWRAEKYGERGCRHPARIGNGLERRSKRVLGPKPAAPDVVANDTNGAVDVFRRDRTMDVNLRASVDAMGAQATGPSYDARISGDGSTILFQSEDAPYTDHDAQTLDSFFLKTSWPGLRLLPAHGETSEGEIQIARLVREAPAGKSFYRYLRDALDRWKAGHPPKTLPNELVVEGKVDQQRLNAALTETLDVIIIDYQPALTLFQLNNVIASTSLVIPQTMKGFDIATLSTFVTGLLGMLQHILAHERIEIGTGANMLLPTIVQRSNAQDLNHIGNLLEHCPTEILPVFYLRSDAISNASDVYQSVYEYEPDTPGKRKGINRFITNADAVNDAIISRLWPGLERGYANTWMDEFYEDDGEGEA